MTPETNGPFPGESPDGAAPPFDGGSRDPFDGGTPSPARRYSGAGHGGAEPGPPPVSPVPAPVPAASAASDGPQGAPRQTPNRRFVPGVFRLLALLVASALVGAGASLLVARATGWGKETVVKQYIATSGAISGHPADIKVLLATALPSVVAVKAVSNQSNPFFNPRGGGVVTAEGTGVVVGSGGEIITNAHVVSGASTVTVTFNDASERAASIVASDNGNDLALLQVGGVEDLPVLELGDSDSIAAGDGVVAVGYALGLEGGPSVTAGIISATGRTTSTETGFGTSQTLSGLLQTDAPISSGDSGGPLIDAAGRVIGINTMVATSTASTAVNGIGFAIASNTVKLLLPSLRAG